MTPLDAVSPRLLSMVEMGSSATCPKEATGLGPWRREGVEKPFGEVEVRVRHKAIRAAAVEALRRLPAEALNIPTLISITEKGASKDGTLAGLTRRTTYEKGFLLAGSGRTEEVVVQRIELYRDILLQLSERSRVAVIAHELAHAWLNDNVRPDDSKEREAESDGLATSWGFGGELAALANETY
jgi:hypothetical protein